MNAGLAPDDASLASLVAGTQDSVGVGLLVIAAIAVVALVWVLVLLARQRREVHRANGLLDLSRELRHRYDALQAVTKEGVLVVSLSGTVLDISERAAAVVREVVQAASGIAHVGAEQQVPQGRAAFVASATPVAVHAASASFETAGSRSDREPIQQRGRGDPARGGGAVDGHDAQAVAAAPVRAVDDDAVRVGDVVAAEVTRQHGAMAGRIALAQARFGAGEELGTTAILIRLICRQQVYGEARVVRRGGQAAMDAIVAGREMGCPNRPLRRPRKALSGRLLW